MFKRILVAIDLAETDLSKWALEVALDFAKASKGELRIVNVQAPAPLMSIEYAPPDYDQELLLSVEQQLNGIASACDYPLDRLSTIMRFGSIYHEVLAVAVEWNADLIVVGSHRPRTATYLLGSNAATIVRHAKCSVLVVRR